MTVTITGTNDAPTITAATTVALTSGAVVEDGTQSATGTIAFQDVDLTDSHLFTSTLTTGSITTALPGFNPATTALGTLALTPHENNTDTSNLGTVDWTFTIDNALAQQLAVGQVVTQTFTVAIDDQHGGTVTQPVTVTITGTNDAPVVANTGLTGAVTEQVNSGGVVTVGGNALIDRPHVDSATGVIFVDLNNPIQQSGPINEWSIYAGQAGGQVELLIYRPSGNNWTFVGSSPLQTVSSVGINNFTLPSSINVQANDLVAFWYPPGTIPSVEANWDQGQTINNANWPSNPIDAGQLASIFKGTIPNLIGGPNFDNSHWDSNTRTYSIAVESSSGVNLNSSGTIAFTDVDLTDVHSINPTITASSGALGALTADVTIDTTGTGTGGVITWNYSVANSAVAYLAQNETKVENFTVTLNDGHGGTVDRTVSVTITGTNDAPVINTIAETDLNEQTNTSPLTTTIPVTFTDVDLTDVGHTAAITGVVATGVTSGLALNTAALEALITPATVSKLSGFSSGSVNLGFSAASTAFNYLAAGEKLTLTYTVAIDDHAGGVTPQTFAVVITGTNDAPVVETNVKAPAIVAGDIGDQKVGIFNGDGAGGFTAASFLTTGGTGSTVAVGDIDGDGNPDIVTVDHGPGGGQSDVSILRGDGHGGFLNAYTVPTGNSGPMMLSLGDVNNDGVVDAVAVNINSGTAYVVKSDGHGGFAATSPVLIGGSGTAAMTLGDITGDGNSDLVIANYNNFDGVPGAYGNGDIGILAGNGHGSFAAPVYLSPNSGSQHPVGVAVGDLNGDGIADIVVVDQGHSILDVNGNPTGHSTDDLNIFLSNARGGGFAPPVRILLDDTVANSPSVAIGDVNGDGRLDIVTADSYYGTLRVFSGDGNGGLSDPTVIHTGASMLSLTLGDVNGDGKVDIVAAVAGSANGPGVVVLPQNSQGSFSAADLISLSSSSFDYAGSHYPTSVAVTPAQGIVNYTENHAPIAIDPYLTLSDADSPMLSSAKVQITNFVSGEDVLGFTNQNGITSSYNAATGVMTLSGTASLANYQAVLRSVTYANSSYDPSATPRTVSFSVNDGATLNSDSNIQSATVIVIPVNDAPVATVPTSHYSATAQANLNLHNTGLSVADVDGGSSVETATLSASQGIITVSAGDSNVSNISGNGSGSVSFSGTIAQINALLNSGSASEIYNYNAGYSATTVTLDLAIRDAGNLSSSTSSTIDVAGSGPKAFADTIAATAGRPTSGLSAVLKSNDIGTPLTIVSVDNAQHGSVALNGSDPIFTPDANYSGVASFAYTISDAASPPAPGMFGTQTVATVGTSPYALATGDFNGDGKLDVLVANSGSNTVSYLAGNGDGTYAPKQDLTVGGTPVAISTGDINHDGKLDFVVANNSGSFSVLLGNGNGTFQTSSITGGLSSALPNSIALGDVNNDGKLDLVSIISGSGVTDIWTQLGNGDGTFQSRTRQVAAGGAEAQSVILADVNGDGKLDAIVADGQVDNGVNILLGNGDGTYQTRTGIATQSQPVALSTGDINHDGKLDLVVADAGANRISVFLGNGNGTFQAETTWSTQSHPVDVKLVDINEDGNLDLVFVDSGADRISTRLGNGDGTFQSELTYATGASPYALAVGDLNSDGRPDLIAANYGAGTLSTLLNASPGGHLSSATVTVNVAPAIRVAVIGSSSSTDTQLAAQLNDHTYFNFAATVINTNSYSSSAAWTSALANYDVVVVGDSGPLDPIIYGTATFTALYAALHAYVDSGHGVVSTGWYDAAITSTWKVLGPQATADADYISPDHAGGPYNPTITGTATFTGNHPITNGITNFAAGPYWEHPTSMDANATVLATVRSTPVVAYEQNHLVYLAPIYMGNLGADTSSLRSGVADHLLENSVAWASGSLDAVIHTDALQVTQNSGSTVVSGMQITDLDPAATSFTISAVTSGVGSSTVTPSFGSGSLAAINAELASGITYNPGSTPPATDKVTVTVTDNVGATDTVNFIFNVAPSPSQPVTLTSTTGKDVLFGTGYQDQFVFAANSNHDTIMNFTPGQDHIDLTALSAVVNQNNLSAWFAANVAASPTNSADTLVTLDATDNITLHNVAVANLHTSDFIIHV